MSVGDPGRGVRAADLLLVDFDGPLARLLPGGRWLELSREVRSLAAQLGGPDLAAAMEGQDDHVQCLRLAAEAAPELVAPLADLCTRVELESAREVSPARHAVDLLEQTLARGAAVVVVTNNDPQVVPLVLDRARPGLGARLTDVLGRVADRPEDLKPSPAMLLRALAGTGEGAGTAPGRAVFLGDSVTDVQAGHAAGVPVVGVAEDATRRAELLEAGARAVVPDVGHLLDPPP